MRIERFIQEKSEEWDEFIDASVNGHFMFKRGYMDYHKEKFKDHSLLIYKDELIVAVVPANEGNGGFYTHQGLTFGGVIHGSKVHAADAILILELTMSYIKMAKFNSFTYKLLPWIYSQGREEFSYALNKVGAELTRRDISSVVNLRYPLEYRTLKKRNVKKAVKAALTIDESNDVAALWKIVKEVLSSRHSTDPTHTEQEMGLLMGRFPDNIKIYLVKDKEEILGGTVLYINRDVVHTQYLAVNEKGRNLGALDFLIDNLIRLSIELKYNYFSLGISTEKEGRVLNEGLIFQKEGFGARGMVHDFYRLEF